MSDPATTAPIAAPLIDVQDVTRTYRSGRSDVPALRGVSLRVEQGEWVAIVGPSGCGKSTLLNLLSGIDQPDSGSVYVQDRRIDVLSQDALARWRGRAVGIVFQFFQLMPTLTAIENVLLPMDLVGYGTSRRARALDLLQRVGVADLAQHLPSELSGGEQQRVAIARALANDPPLLLADEPTGNLDRRSGAVVIELLQGLWQEGRSIIMVTHDEQVAAQAQRVITMQDGSIVGDVVQRERAPSASVSG